MMKKYTKLLLAIVGLISCLQFSYSADTKFSQFSNGGNFQAGDTTVGLRGGVNTKFNTGSIASQNSNSVNVTGGTITGVSITNSQIDSSAIGQTTPAAVATNSLAITNSPAHSLPIGEASSPLSFINLTNGQLLIGSTGADPVGATLTAGSGMSITNGAGSISIASTRLVGLSNLNASVNINLTNPQTGAYQIVTGSGHTITLAAANASNSMPIGSTITFYNITSNTTTLNDNGGTTLTNLDPNSITTVMLIDNSTAAGMYQVVESTSLNTASSIVKRNSLGAFSTSNIALTSPASHGLLIGEGSSNINSLTLSNNQIAIGNTGADPTAVNLVAGTGISIGNAGGNLTFSAIGTGFTWNTITGTSQALAAENGYYANNAALVTFTLPATCTIQDNIIISGQGAGGFKIAQNAGQQIISGNSSTTVGVTGFVSSTYQYDEFELRCMVANTTWKLIPNSGNPLFN